MLLGQQSGAQLQVLMPVNVPVAIDVKVPESATCMELQAASLPLHAPCTRCLPMPSYLLHSSDSSWNFSFVLSLCCCISAMTSVKLITLSSAAHQRWLLL